MNAVPAQLTQDRIGVTRVTQLYLVHMFPIKSQKPTTKLLKYLRTFHIFNTTTTLDVWTRRVRGWKELQNMGIETMVIRMNG